MLNLGSGYRKTMQINGLVCQAKGSSRFECRDLLSELTPQELDVLAKHSDLLEQIFYIAGMDSGDLTSRLKESGLEVQPAGGGCMYVDCPWDKDYYPQWAKEKKLPTTGFLVPNTLGSEWPKWARSWLLQSVRVILWERILKEKKKAKEREDEIMTAMAGYGGYV